MTAPLKIAFVIDRYFEFGGLQRDCLRMAVLCAEKGNEVTIITGSWLGKKPDNIIVNEVDANAFTNTGKISRLEQAMESIRFEKPFDCIIGFKKMGGLDLYYAGDPCFAAKLNTQSFIKRLMPRYKKMLKKEAAVFSPESRTRILLIAHQEQEKFRHYYGTSKDRFYLLPPGIDKKRLVNKNFSQQDRQALRIEFNIKEHDFLVLQVGSSFRTKGVDRSITAIAGLPGNLKEKTKLIIIGAGDVAPYHAMASQLNITDKIIFPGPQKDVSRFYYSADLLIHPAVTENTGTAILEAMVCGLPVLTTENCGYASHVISAQAGGVSPVPFNQAGFNLLLEGMLDSSRLDKWSKNGLRYSQTEDLYSMIDKATDIIIKSARAGKS
ncbi:MAG: glycosyltransferase family 4 protein [Acidiferrobacterales bacterium]